MQKFIFTFLILLTAFSLAKAEDNIKKPNVSGQFYNADPRALSEDMARSFHAARIMPLDEKVQIVISPHAGYVYSGDVAAYSYKAVSKNTYRTVIVIGLSHFTEVDGFAIWPEGAFETPLGQVAVDSQLCTKLMEIDSKVKSVPQAFEREHSLEVELPFLQKIFKDFKIVPLLTGRPNLKDAQILAASLNELIGTRDDILVVISTDMSHYYPDEKARQMDTKALFDISNLQAERFWSEALFKNIEMCNFTGVEVALVLAKLRGIDNVRVLHYANSGDVTGDKSGVVGYCSVVFYKTKKGGNEMKKQDTDSDVVPLTKEQKKRLIDIAKKTIIEYVQKKQVSEFTETDSRLSLEEGAFVTLHKHGELRGCIGNIVGQGPLYQTVKNMAVAAATEDPRFPPLTKDELKDIEIEISVLSMPKRIANPEEIQMGVHGVIVSQGFNRGIFLPQVANETGWSRGEFLSNLCAHKAGLAPDAWKDPQTTLEIFTAQVFNEKDVSK